MAICKLAVRFGRTLSVVCLAISLIADAAPRHVSAGDIAPKRMTTQRGNSTLHTCSSLVFAHVPVRGFSSPRIITDDGRRSHAFVSGYDSHGDAAPYVDSINLATGKLLRIIYVGKLTNDLAVDSTTGRVFVLYPAKVSIFDSHGRYLSTTLVSHHAVQLVLIEKARRIFSVSADGAIDVLDTASGKRLRTVSLPGGVVQGYAAITAVDEHTMHVFVLHRFDVSGHYAVSMFDGHDGSLLRTIKVGAHPTAIDIDPRSEHVFILDTPTSSVHILDARSGKFLYTVHLPSSVHPPDEIVVDPRAGRVFIGGESTQVRILDATSGALLDTVSLPGPVHQDRIAYINSLDKTTGRLFIFTEGRSTTANAQTHGPYYLQALDVKTGTIVRTITLGQASGIPGTIIALDERTQHALIWNYNGPLPLINVACL